jgi:hypothetical protein
MYYRYICFVGAVADFRLSYGRTFSRKSKIIAVNRSKEQLLKVKIICCVLKQTLFFVEKIFLSSLCEFHPQQIN